MPPSEGGAKGTVSLEVKKIFPSALSRSRLYKKGPSRTSGDQLIGRWVTALHVLTLDQQPTGQPIVVLATCCSYRCTDDKNEDKIQYSQ